MWKNINQIIGTVLKITYIPALNQGETMIENEQKNC